MAIIYDTNGNVMDGYDRKYGYLVPETVIHHEAVEAVTHEETMVFPGGELTYTVVDVPAKAAYDEVVSFIYHPSPPSALDKVEAQVAYTAMMTNTLLEG